MEYKEKIVLLLIGILILISNSIGMYSQEMTQMANTNPAIILYENYQKYKDVFLQKSIERLHQSISKDEYLKNTFYFNDSALFKKLTIVINPLMKLKPEAVNYNYEDDIFDYVVLDTINYDCTAAFYLGDTLCFTITRGYNDCDDNFIFYEDPAPEWCKGEFYFFQHFYEINRKDYCYKSESIAFNDAGLIFLIDGLEHSIFVIKDKNISIYPTSERDIKKGLLDRPNDFVRKTYKEEFIRRCARKCSMSKTKK